MKYKVLSSVKTGNILDTVLYNRGIYDKVLFLNPDNSSNTNLDLIVNIKKGIELIKNNLNKRILILVDSDCDGIASGAIIYKYLKMINPFIDIEYYLHDEKRHGLTDEFMCYLDKKYIKGKHFDLIIVPDAGSNDIKNIDKLVNVNGSEILIIDHHEIEILSEYGVIINNQICDNTNRNLTGAGMVLRFCEKLNEEYNLDIDELRNIAMLGLISDTADLTENEVRNICLTSIKSIKNKFIKTFYEVKGIELEDLTIKDLSFGGIIPYINSVLRVGTLEEKIMLFKALAGALDESKITCVEKRKLNKETRKYEMVEFYLTEYELVIDECEKVRKRQNTLIDNLMKKFEKRFNKDTGIQVFITDEDDDIGGVAGLVAMKLADKLGQPTMVVTLKDDGFYIGSLRGNTKVLADFKEWCLNTGLFEYVQGHANASGVCFKKENLERLIEVSKNIVAEEVVEEVDFEYNNFIPEQDVLMIGNNKHLWCTGCKEPVFVVKNVRVPKMYIRYTKKTLRIWINGVTFIKFNVSEEEYEELTLRNGFEETVNISFMGKFSTNKYMGRENAQVVITDYEIIENKKNNEFGIFF